MRPVIPAIALSLLISTAAFAQTGAPLLLKPLMHDNEVWESGGNALILADGNTSNNEDFQMNVFDYAGRVRERNDPFVPRLGWDFTYLNLNTDDPGLTQDLVDVSVGAGVELGEYSKWRTAFALGVGYAGNSPFGEGDAYYGMATFRVGRQLSAKTDLSLVIDYNGNRSIFPDIPLPGFAYRHQYDPKLTYVLGIPVSTIIYRPNDPISIIISWTLIDSFDAEVNCDLSPHWRLFSALAARSEAFTVDGLSGDDRLLFQQRRAEAGVQWKPGDETRLILAAGYAFSGEFSVGFDQRRSDEVADLSDEPYVRFGFERRF